MNGASERMIRKVSQILRTVVWPDQLDWPKHLPMVEFSINSSIVASTGYVPFELTYRYVPKMIKTIKKNQIRRSTGLREQSQGHGTQRSRRPNQGSNRPNLPRKIKSGEVMTKDLSPEIKHTCQWKTLTCPKQEHGN